MVPRAFNRGREPMTDHRRLPDPAQVPAHDHRRLPDPAQVPAHDERRLPEPTSVPGRDDAAELLAVAVEVTRGAAELARELRTRGVSGVATKSTSTDVVTEADKA